MTDEATPNPEAEKKQKPKDRSKGFFAIDRRSWADACNLGINEAVAYLVLASGTDKQNKTTSWSVCSITARTGMSRKRYAKEAIQNLLKSGLMKLLKGGLHPQYEIVPYEIYKGIYSPQRPPMTDQQQYVYDAIQTGQNTRAHFKGPRGPRNIDALIAVRWIREKNGTLKIIPEAEHLPRNEWIFIPNTFVDGTPMKETPPIKKLRQTQDPMLLRLCVDLYYLQDLENEGGINRKILCENYERKRIGTREGKLILAFKGIKQKASNLPEFFLTDNDKTKTTEQRSKLFWSRLNTLVDDLGLVEKIPYLYEANTDKAEQLCPCGTGGTNSFDDEIGTEMEAAARALLREMSKDGFTWSLEGPGRWQLTVVPKHMKNAELIGIFRMRYRTQIVSKTRKWYAELGKVHGELVPKLRKLTADSTARQSRIAAAAMF